MVTASYLIPFLDHRVCNYYCAMQKERVREIEICERSVIK